MIKFDWLSRLDDAIVVTALVIVVCAWCARVVGGWRAGREQRPAA